MVGRMVQGYPAVVRRITADIRKAAYPIAASIHLQPAGLDRALPPEDLVGDELGEVFRAPALGRNAGHTDLEHPAVDRRSVHGCVRDLVEPVDDRSWRALRQKNAVQVVTSKPVSPCSCAVARFGINGVRPPDSTAIAFTCLPTISGAAAPRLPHR